MIDKTPPNTDIKKSTTDVMLKQTSSGFSENEGGNTFWAEIKKWFEVYRDVKDSRGRILKTASYLTLAIIIISANFSILSASNTIKVISAILLNIGTSVLAAALIEISAKMREQWEQGWIEKKFRALFSCDLNQGSVAIVLPKFPIFGTDEAAETDPLRSGEVITIIPSELRDFRAHKDITSLSHKDLSLSDNHFAALADVLAASYLISLFEKLHLPVPIVMFDDEAFEMVSKSSHGKVSTFISVGLFSNELTMWVNKQNDLDRYFKIEHVDINHHYIKLAACQGDKILMDEKRWTHKYEYFHNSENSNFALIAKVPINNNKATVIILGGLTSYSTRRVGEYVQKQWERILTWRDEATRQEVQALPFAGVFEIPVKDNEEVSPSGVRVARK